MSKKIKIVSNPYKREIKYFDFNEINNEWENIIINNPNSKLRETESEKSFLPFKIKDIIDIIIEEYYVNNSKIELLFEGTNDEFQELKEICNEQEFIDKISIERLPNNLENARVILKPIKELFDEVHPVIEKIIKNDEHVKKDLNKVSEALKDIIPICVFGNYSAGKSTFINALIGYEILPSGGDPVTAKVYKISRSKDSDVVRIKFQYNSENYELLFENDEYRVLTGNTETSLLKEIQNQLNEIENKTMIIEINSVLGCINNYDRQNKEVVIGNVIEVETPFSKNGILGQSYNKFVIFDTPGSNSETNLDHKKVLEEALEGFSNGIPVWISTYESIDSTDNASLCEKILDIKALDKRFTMIVLNKADGSDLIEEEFDEEQKKIILGYNSVDKMYASGIYFLSSIMGIGAKNDGKLIDKHYRKIYRSQDKMYSDSEDEDYARLYKYNIMPKQIKKNALEYSDNCSNLVYANSGLFCVEMEMEKFASRYAAYNKCQMVYLFLNDVITETNKRINTKTESLLRTIEARKQELNIEEQQLIDNIKNSTTNLKTKYEKETNEFVKEYANNEIDYTYKKEEMLNKAKEINDQNSEERNFDAQEKSFYEAKNIMFSHMKFDFRNLFKDGFVNSFRTKIDNIQKDFSDMKTKKEVMDKVEDKVNEETADELVEIVVEDYKKNALEIRDILLSKIKEVWNNNTQKLKEELISIVVGTDSLSTSQKEEISEIIINFSSQKIEDDADEIFIKSKYLYGKLFGFRIFDTEKINVKKLIGSYNNQIKKYTNSLAEQINKSCKDSFMQWENNLELLIINNITKYNPSLRAKTDMINDDNERIIELKQSQEKIEASLEAIEDLISWKNI